MMQQVKVNIDNVQANAYESDTGYSKKTFAIKNPATGKEIDSYPLMSKDEVDKLIINARNKTKEWSKTTFAERKKILIKASQYLTDNAMKFAEELAAENGKTPFDALIAEVFTVIDHTRYIAKHGKKALKTRKKISTNIAAPLRKISYVFEPKGVVGIIAPWNYPFTLAGGPVAAALMAGNTVVFKPSSQTTRSGMILKEMYDYAGLPEGVFQVLTGSGSVTGQAMIENKGFDMIFFTGSTEVGLEVGAQAAKNLIPVVLELGGTDVAIITKNADLKRAAHGVAWGSFTNTGQTCLGTETILVEKSVYEPFVEKLIAVMKNLKLGKKAGEIGSMTMKSQQRIVEAQLRDALDKGAKILYQSTEKPDDLGIWCPPTLLGDVTTDMDVFMDETFGPLKSIIPFESVEEAIELANSMQYGLSGCVYTRDLKEGRWIAAGLKTGSVNINDSLLTYGIPELPFGGVKKSGLGYYHGEMGIQVFADVKAITETNVKLKKEIHWYPTIAGVDKVMVSMLKLLYSGSIVNRAKAAISLIPHSIKIGRSMMR